MEAANTGHPEVFFAVPAAQLPMHFRLLPKDFSNGAPAQSARTEQELFAFRFQLMDRYRNLFPSCHQRAESGQLYGQKRKNRKQILQFISFDGCMPALWGAGPG